jgi:hypothetical protein
MQSHEALIFTQVGRDDKTMLNPEIRISKSEKGPRAERERTLPGGQRDSIRL